MTRQDALAEARRLWGNGGSVAEVKAWDDDLNDGQGGEEDYFLVGIGEYPVWFERGGGWTWEEAFQDAAER